MPLGGKEAHSTTWLTNVSPEDTAAQVERLAPDVAMILIAALSLVCWVPLVSTAMAMWSAFN
jgi:hypothetical protein